MSMSAIYISIRADLTVRRYEYNSLGDAVKKALSDFENTTLHYPVLIVCDGVEIWYAFWKYHGVSAHDALKELVGDG